jgi:hypothetical protein
VRHIVRTFDGREASVEYTISVRTHDVAITSASFPKTANSGQTKIITISVKSSFSSEYVTVQLLKSVPGGMAPVGEITQWVPLKPGGRATDFVFSYTFTPQDADFGKVTFKAVAVIVGYNDCHPADNEIVSLPVKVMC